MGRGDSDGRADPENGFLEKRLMPGVGRERQCEHGAVPVRRKAQKSKQQAGQRDMGAGGKDGQSWNHLSVKRMQCYIVTQSTEPTPMPVCWYKYVVMSNPKSKTVVTELQEVEMNPTHTP